MDNISDKSKLQNQTFLDNDSRHHSVVEMDVNSLQLSSRHFVNAAMNETTGSIVESSMPLFSGRPSDLSDAGQMDTDSCAACWFDQQETLGSDFNKALPKKVSYNTNSFCLPVYGQSAVKSESFISTDNTTDRLHHWREAGKALRTYLTQASLAVNEEPYVEASGKIMTDNCTSVCEGSSLCHKCWNVNPSSLYDVVPSTENCLFSGYYQAMPTSTASSATPAFLSLYDDDDDYSLLQNKSHFRTSDSNCLSDMQEALEIERISKAEIKDCHRHHDKSLHLVDFSDSESSSCEEADVDYLWNSGHEHTRHGNENTDYCGIVDGSFADILTSLDLSDSASHCNISSTHHLPFNHTQTLSKHCVEDAESSLTESDRNLSPETGDDASAVNSSAYRSEQFNIGQLLTDSSVEDVSYSSTSSHANQLNGNSSQIADDASALFATPDGADHILNPEADSTVIATESNSTSSGDSVSSWDGDLLASEAEDEFECECPVCLLHRDNIAGGWQRSTQIGLPDGTDISQSASSGLFSFTFSEPDYATLLNNSAILDSLFQDVIVQMLQYYPDLMSTQTPPALTTDEFTRLESLQITQLNLDDELACSICLCQFESGDTAKRLPCQHLFHSLCIQCWLSKTGTCPVCRDIVMNKLSTL